MDLSKASQVSTQVLNIPEPARPKEGMGSPCPAWTENISFVGITLKPGAQESSLIDGAGIIDPG